MTACRPRYRSDCARRFWRFLVETVPISGHCHVFSTCRIWRQNFPAGSVAATSSNSPHHAQIMFSMLEVIFRRYRVATQGFDAGQFQITLIISLGVLRGLCVGAAEPGRINFLEPGFSRHCVGHIFRLRARLCRRWLKFGSVVHGSPCAAAAKPRDVHSRDCRCDTIGGRIALAAAIENQLLRWDVELVQQGNE